MPAYCSSRYLLLLFVVMLRCMPAMAQDLLEKNLWYNEEKTARIQIYKGPDSKFYGKVVWLKVPDMNGKPKTDMKNPDKNHQNDPIIGLLLLKGFKKDGENAYTDGTVYDPKNGKTYKCNITAKGDKLDVHGYIGFSFIGRTTVWTKAD